MTICAQICSGMCTSPSRLAWINGARGSPLALLIESIEEVLGVFEGHQLFAGVGPNPFNRDPRSRWSTRGFRPETVCHHDITLLQSQLGGLRELSAGLDSW
jgi:hypothetical protein